MPSRESTGTIARRAKVARKNFRYGTVFKEHEVFDFVSPFRGVSSMTWPPCIPRPATSGDNFTRLISTLWPRKDQGVTRGTVDQYMAKIIDFSRVIRTASDFALVGHVACKAASKQVLLASSQEESVDATVTLNIRRELKRIFVDSAPLIQTALTLRISIGQVCFLNFTII